MRLRHYRKTGFHARPNPVLSRGVGGKSGGGLREWDDFWKLSTGFSLMGNATLICHEKYNFKINYKRWISLSNSEVNTWDWRIRTLKRDRALWQQNTNAPGGRIPPELSRNSEIPGHSDARNGQWCPSVVVRLYAGCGGPPRSRLDVLFAQKQTQDVLQRPSAQIVDKTHNPCCEQGIWACFASWSFRRFLTGKVIIYKKLYNNKHMRWRVIYISIWY